MTVFVEAVWHVNFWLSGVNLRLRYLSPPKKRQMERVFGEICFGNFTWKFFFSCLVLCPGDFLCPQATCFLCHIHIIHSHCLLLCSQLLEGSFTSQVSHEVDGLIFQPIGVSLIQIQTGKWKMHCDCKLRLWGKWRLDVTLPHNNYLQLAEE